MRGKHHLIVQSRYLKYEMDFCRNITVIQGDSATGKTTLVDMIREYNLNGNDTGISVQSDLPCRVLEGMNWEEDLDRIQGCLVFIDEGNRFVASENFARKIQGTDNYYVIVTRESMDNLPYSVTEIYGIRSSGKYASLTPVYHQMYRIYGDLSPIVTNKPSNIITEDSNSGYEFFMTVADRKGIQCVSAGGSGSIFEELLSHSQDMSVVVADGAAFGSQMKRVYQLIGKRKNAVLYLPESFEWIILSSEILKDAEVHDILNNPADFIDGAEYVSWERFFTKLLVEKTAGSHLAYVKKKLNPVYIQGGYFDKIVKVLPEIFD